MNVISKKKLVYLTEKKLSKNTTSRPDINGSCVLGGTEYELGCTVES